MAIFSSDSYGKVVITITGRFDFGCHPDFRAVCSKIGSGAEVVVDLEKATYVDSAALGMLLLLRDRVGDARRIQIINCQGQPDQVLRIANFDQIFQYARA